MEKDKHRSVISVGMLACSMLLLSALFIGCGPCQRPPCAHPQNDQAAFYHNQNPSGDTITWYVTPRIAGDTAPCPWDSTALNTPDYVRCLECGVVLQSPPCLHPSLVAWYHHTDGVGHDTVGALPTVTWFVDLPPFSDPLGTPTPQTCPTGDGVMCNADSTTCRICGAKTWTAP